MTRLEAVTTEDPAQHALELVTWVVADAVERRGRCLLSLAGGRTPAELYRRLAGLTDLPWPAVSVYWGDERFVPPEHPDSNARSARETLLDHVPVPSSQVHPWPILATPEASAAAYVDTLLRTAGDPPLFDLTLLGLGSDCHTASLFPGGGSHLASGLTVTSRPGSASSPRLSLTARALSSSRTVLFLVTGAEKRQAVATLLASEGDAESCPARAVSALEKLLLITDQPLPT